MLQGQKGKKKRNEQTLKKRIKAFLTVGSPKKSFFYEKQQRKTYVAADTEEDDFYVISDTE